MLFDKSFRDFDDRNNHVNKSGNTNHEANNLTDWSEAQGGEETPCAYE